MKKAILRGILSSLLILCVIFSMASCIDDAVVGGSINEETTDSQILAFYEELQDNDAMPFSMSEKSKKFISENEKMFTENKNEGIEKLTDYSLEYKFLNKNIDKYGDKLLCLPKAYVVKIEETPLDDETSFTEMQLMDDDENMYYFMSISSYEDIFEGDTVSVYALPIGKTSFENVSGGTTLAIVMAGCYVEK